MWLRLKPVNRIIGTDGQEVINISQDGTSFGISCGCDSGDSRAKLFGLKEKIP
jgi:hypothetical protein